MSVRRGVLGGLGGGHLGLGLGVTLLSLGPEGLLARLVAGFSGVRVRALCSTGGGVDGINLIGGILGHGHGGQSEEGDKGDKLQVHGDCVLSEVEGGRGVSECGLMSKRKSGEVGQ